MDAEPSCSSTMSALPLRTTEMRASGRASAAMHRLDATMTKIQNPRSPTKRYRSETGTTRSRIQRCVSDRRRSTCQIQSASMMAGTMSSQRYKGAANRNVLKSTGNISAFAFNWGGFAGTSGLIALVFLERHIDIVFARVAGFQNGAYGSVRIAELRRNLEGAALHQIVSQPRKVLVVVRRIFLALRILQNADVGLHARVNRLQGLLPILRIQSAGTV